MKNVMLALLATLLCLMLTTSNIHAQYSPEYTTYRDSSIYLQNLGSFNTRFIMNGQNRHTGFMGRDLKLFLEISPNAVVEFKKYRVDSNIGNVLTFVGMGLFAVSLSFPTESDDIIKNPTLLSIGVLTGTAGGLFKWAASNHLLRSVAFYNQELLR
ncbi:MAG: hypothetical protein AAF849_23745 [Bacteroidota bacterium]